MIKRLITIGMPLLLCIGLFAFRSAPVAAESLPDLAITEFSWNNDTQVTPGTPIKFSVTLKNEGTASITEPFCVAFRVVTEDSILTSTPSYFGGLVPGSSVTLESKEWVAVAGDYMIIADAEGQLDSEISWKNNTKQANLRVATQKLAPESKDIQSMLEKGGITDLIFSDDFDSISTVDTTDSGKIGYKWYVDRPYGAVTLTSKDYTVKDGVMTVHNVIPTYNYGLGTYHPDKKVGFTFNTGYLEVRLRIPRPRANTGEEKGVPAIWALPDTKLTNQSSHWVEVDWLEYWGITSSRTQGYYTVCLHEQYTNPETWYKNSNYSHQGLGDGEWHTMGWLWQKGLFVTYLDGTEVMRMTYAEGEDPSPKHTVVEGENYLGAYTQLDKQMLPIIIGGSEDNPLELDYVRVWDGGNNAYTPDKIERQEMLPADFLHAYTEDADGNPIITVNKDNYMYILYGEAEWKKMSASTQKIVNGALEIKGQATYPELLKQAKAVQDNLNNHTHSYTTVITKATSTTNGSKNVECKICGVIKSSTKIYRPYSFNLSKSSYTYNGAVQVPTVTIKDYAGKVIPSDNYTVKRVTGCKNAGTHSLLVTMKGNYSGNKTLTYKINPIKSDTCTFKVTTSAYTYNGTVRTPSVIVKNANGTTLKKDTHYTVKRVTGCKNAGTHKLLITMKGNYGGSKTLTFKINPIKSDTCTFKVATSAYTYNGTVRVPSVIVKNANGSTLKKDTHYTVKRVTGCKDVGTHKLLITMKGNYSGSKTLTFKINPINISKCSIKASSATYTGSVKIPTVTVKNANGTTLKKDTHYTVKRVTGCKTIGTHKVLITMKGNYSGSKTVTFKIVPPKTEITQLELASRSVKVGVKQLTATKSSGYQIQHSASSTFTNATTKTLSGYRTTTCSITLPATKRTYYVRVRTYKIVNGVRYYSAWNTYSYQKTI